MRIAVLLVALLGAHALQAQPAAALALQLVPGQSFVRFVSKQMNVPVEGVFKKFSAQIAWNAARPEASTARLELEPGSIDLGLEDINKEARGKDWFDVAAQPTALFVASALKAAGPGRYEAAGKLSIKGRTRDITAVFTAKQDSGGWLFEGAFPIKRLEFGVGEGSWGDPSVVANEVEIRFRLLVTPAAARK